MCEDVTCDEDYNDFNDANHKSGYFEHSAADFNDDDGEGPYINKHAPSFSSGSRGGKRGRVRAAL